MPLYCACTAAEQRGRAWPAGGVCTARPAGMASKQEGKVFIGGLSWETTGALGCLLGCWGCLRGRRRRAPALALRAARSPGCRGARGLLGALGAADGC